MIDDLLSTLRDDPLARAIEDLRALAACDGTSAEMVARAQRLCGSRGLATLLDLARRGALVPTSAQEDPILSGTRSIPDVPRLEAGTVDRIFDDARAEAIDHAAGALRHAITTSTHAPGPVVVVVDAGTIRQRRLALAQIAAPFLSELAIVDATRDPFLTELNGADDRVVAVLDGDLAPALDDALAASRHRATIVTMPHASVRSLGDRFSPDVVLTLPAGQVPPRGPGAEPFHPSWLDAALDIVPDGDAAQAPLPSGEALIAVLEGVMRERSGAEKIRILRRLALTGHAEAVRALLVNRAVPGDLTEPRHALAWSALYRSVGLPEQSWAVLDTGAANFGANPRVIHGRAMSLLQLNKPSEAQRELEALSSRQDTSAATKVYTAHALARIYRRAGNLAAAREAIATGLELEPGNVHLLVELGIVESHDGNADLAESVFRRTNLLLPHAGFVLNAWALAVARTGAAGRAEQMLRRARAMEPWNERHDLELASLAKNRGLVAEAEAIYQPRLASPDVVTRQRALLQLADLYVEAGRWRDAEEHVALLERALETVSTLDRDARARWYSIRAKLAAAQGDQVAAFRWLERGASTPYLLAQSIDLELDALAAEPVDERKLDRARLRRIEQGLGELRQLAPSDAGPAAVQEPAPYAQAGHAADPDTSLVAATLTARFQALQGEWAGARETMEAALERVPRSPIVLNAWAEIEWLAARESMVPGVTWRASLDRALALAQDALDIDPRNAYTHRLLATLRRAAGDPDAADRHVRYLRLAGLPEAPRSAGRVSLS